MGLLKACWSWASRVWGFKIFLAEVAGFRVWDPELSSLDDPRVGSFEQLFRSLEVPWLMELSGLGFRARTQTFQKTLSRGIYANS